VHGTDNVIARIHSCWASLYGERALTMRAHGLGTAEPAMAVVVQAMVDAEKSGTVAPTGTTGELLIEATFGLGEPIISGAVEPDRYIVDRHSHAPLAMTIGRKQIVLWSGDDAQGHTYNSPERRSARVLSDAELGELSALSTAIDQCLGTPNELEWSIDQSGVQVIQARPVTPTQHVVSRLIEEFVSGLGVGPGWATGRVRVIDRFEELDGLRAGEILVAAETAPEWTPALIRAAGVVTDGGDASCHAAHVATEHGIPAIVGTRNATTRLTTGMTVTVDARRGWVLPAVQVSEAT
jgi:pyruvate,water dikinase